jgi:hypothetical protein
MTLPNLGKLLFLHFPLFYCSKFSTVLEEALAHRPSRLLASPPALLLIGSWCISLVIVWFWRSHSLALPKFAFLMR